MFVLIFMPRKRVGGGGWEQQFLYTPPLFSDTFKWQFSCFSILRTLVLPSFICLLVILNRNKLEHYANINGILCTLTPSLSHSLSLSRPSRVSLAVWQHVTQTCFKWELLETFCDLFRTATSTSSEIIRNVYFAFFFPLSPSFWCGMQKKKSIGEKKRN